MNKTLYSLLEISAYNHHEKKTPLTLFTAHLPGLLHAGKRIPEEPDQRCRNGIVAPESTKTELSFQTYREGPPVPTAVKPVADAAVTNLKNTHAKKFACP